MRAGRRVPARTCDRAETSQLRHQSERQIKEAIMLAGGRGTRLASVLPDRQKVTAEVSGAPFVLRVIDWLEQAGIERLVLAAGHRAEDLQETLRLRHARLPQIVISTEAQPLGTAGAVRLAADLARSNPVLV